MTCDNIALPAMLTRLSRPDHSLSLRPSCCPRFELRDLGHSAASKSSVLCHVFRDTDALVLWILCWAA